MKLIKIPFSAGGLGKADGSELAPDQIVEKLNELYLNEDGKQRNFEIQEINIDNHNVEQSHKNIQEQLPNEKSIIIGGDHSITYSTFKAFVKNNPNAGLIIFDAHPDCENNFSPPSQEDFVKVLVEENILDPQKIIMIGIRNMHELELKFMHEKNIRTFSMKTISELNSMQDMIDAVMETAKKWPSLYISIDIDAIDPVFAPGTGYNEPGGFTSRELITIIQRFKLLPNIGMIDLVEVNPKKDINNLTVKLAAKIIKELS
ncbi:arginase family protein [Nanoarchaeota archaeon]